MFNNKEITYFITGGGTGGHIYPAVSVIDALYESGVEAKNIFYLGNKKNLEYEIAHWRVFDCEACIFNKKYKTSKDNKTEIFQHGISKL